MTAPRVSVVIPAYNASRTLRATVASALAQTMNDIEVLIVDDGSSDDTLAVARSLESDKVSAMTQRNAGAAAARNTGIRAATGEYVAFLDADDLWLPHKLQRQLEHLERHPQSDAVQCGSYFVDDSLRLLYVKHCTDTGNALMESLQFQNLPAFLSALIVKRTKLLAFGGFDTRLEILEEWDMALKASRHCAMRSVPDPLVLYRVHPGNRHRNVDIHIKPGHIILESLFAEPDLPDDIRRLQGRIYGVFYRTLAGGYHNAGKRREFFRWMARSIRRDPAQIFYMLAMPLRRLRRKLSRVRAGGAESKELQEMRERFQT